LRFWIQCIVILSLVLTSSCSALLNLFVNKKYHFVQLNDNPVKEEIKAEIPAIKKNEQ
jgi:hypothetical protein